MGEAVSLSAAVAKREAEHAAKVQEQSEADLAHAIIRRSIAAAQHLGVADHRIALSLLLHGGLLVGARAFRAELSGFLADLDFLETLPGNEFRSGLAEVLKCGFIADPAILDEFEADPAAAIEPASALQAKLIRRAVAVKAAVVSADLRERTSEGSDIGREALNYGHTLGHAIERQEHFLLRHGEAVAIGMVFAAELAHRLGLIDADLVARHRRVLTLAGLPTSYPEGAWLTLRNTMSLDKKARGSSLRFVLLDGMASPVIVSDPAEGVLADAFLGLNEA